MINILPADKYFIIGDREGFMSACGVNVNLIRIFDKLGPIKLSYSPEEGIYNKFTTLNGEVITSSDLSRAHSTNHSCHITKNEAMSFLVEWDNPKEEEPSVTDMPVTIENIPEIRLTITTMEEAHAAYIMLKGLLNASV